MTWRTSGSSPFSAPNSLPVSLSPTLFPTLFPTPPTRGTSRMTMNEAELAALGYRVENGEAVKVVMPAEAKGEADWREVQRQCYRVFDEAGCTVYWLSQARRTGQTAGLPDLIVFGPPGHPWHAAWETKAGKGKLSEAQRKFALHCQRTGFEYQSGGEYTARQFLKLM